MRGRELFKIFKPYMWFCNVILKLLPYSLCKMVFDLLRYSRWSIGIGLRYLFLKRLLTNCGDNISIRESVWLLWPQKLTVGQNVSIHPLCYIDAQGEIEIGNDVSIAHNVSILSFEHDYSNMSIPIKDTPCIGKKIVIEDNVWIGAGVRILGGVRIGKGSVIGANAVVTKNIPPQSIAVGVPAKVIKVRIE